MSDEPYKNTDPSPPQVVTEEGQILPENDDIPEDDDAEPEDAEVQHLASEEEVEEQT